MSNGVVEALGNAAAGVFTNSDHLWGQIMMAGSLTGDRVWRLPLWKYYSNQVKDYDNVDLSNAGRGKGSACLGAAFLKEFVHCADFIHLDVTGYGMIKRGIGTPYLAHGRMTGRPTRAIIQFLMQMACPDEHLRQLRNLGSIKDEKD